MIQPQLGGQIGSAGSAELAVHPKRVDLRAVVQTGLARA